MGTFVAFNKKMFKLLYNLHFLCACSYARYYIQEFMSAVVVLLRCKDLRLQGLAESDAIAHLHYSIMQVSISSLITTAHAIYSCLCICCVQTPDSQSCKQR